MVDVETVRAPHAQDSYPRSRDARGPNARTRARATRPRARAFRVLARAMAMLGCCWILGAPAANAAQVLDTTGCQSGTAGVTSFGVVTPPTTLRSSSDCSVAF